MLCRVREARRLHPSPEGCSMTSGSRTGGGLERLDASHERIGTSQRSKIDRAHELLRALRLRCALRFGQAGTRSSPRPNGLRTMHGKTTGVCHIFNLGWVFCAASHAGCRMRGTVVVLASMNCRMAAKIQECRRCEKARRRRRGAGTLFSLFHLASTNGCYCPLPFVPTCDALHV
jgi:hypothetical protein